MSNRKKNFFYESSIGFIVIGELDFPKGTLTYHVTQIMNSKKDLNFVGN